MTVKFYFETMTSGMMAKLDPKYRITSNYAHSAVKLSGNGAGGRYFSEKFGSVDMGRKK